MVALIVIAISFIGCSAGQKGLLTITPQQYFYSAKEQLETIDERDYEIRDLDEIIRILENAEKDAKKGEIIDKSRLYMTLAYVIKARKQYQNALMKGSFVANRAAPFYIVDTKDVKETLRKAKKWLRLCKAQFKTSSLNADLQFVEGFFYTQKMLTQLGRDKLESVNKAVFCFRRCIGMAPDYKSDFKLFGRGLTARDVRLKIVSTLALGRQLMDAYALLSEYQFSPISPISGSTETEDFAWTHTKGLVLAMMGKYKEAVKILNSFKIIAPQDYPQVDTALWILEGVFDKLHQVTKEPKYEMEARIVAALLKKLKGPYSKDVYASSSNLFPTPLSGDLVFYNAIEQFYSNNFSEALKTLKPILNGGAISRTNRISAKILSFEASIYSREIVPDELLEQLLAMTMKNNLSVLQKERLGFLLARYVMDENDNEKKNRAEHSEVTFSNSITSKPWALRIKYKRGEIKKRKRPLSQSRKQTEDENKVKRAPGSLIAEIYANKTDDWLVSAKLHIFSLPDLSLIGKGRIVGREEEGKGWIFKNKEIDAMEKHKRYLLIFEYDNSDSVKNVQGVIFSHN